MRAVTRPHLGALTVFTNRHVITALLVAPLLAILAWFLVGAIVAEGPQAARPGQSYPLLEGSNCRYDSAACALSNEDLRLDLSLSPEVAGPVLALDSSHALDQVLLAFAEPTDENLPVRMNRVDDKGQHWRLQLHEVPPGSARLRLVVQRQGSRWYGDASTAFLASFRGSSGND